MPKGLHSPLPASLRSECEKASVILESFITPSITGNPGAALPHQLGNAKSLNARFSSSRFGTCNLSSRRWLLVGSICRDNVWGRSQIGFELTDFVFILTTSGAVRDFAQVANFALSTHLSVAFGPVGRSAEITAVASPKGVSPMFAYSKTKGLYAGLAAEGSFYIQLSPTNKRFYKREVTARQLLSGEIPAPPEAESLMRVLSSEVFSPRSDPESAVTGTRELSESVHTPDLAGVNEPVPELQSNALMPELPTFDTQISELSADTQPYEVEAVPPIEPHSVAAPTPTENENVSAKALSRRKGCSTT